MITVENYNLYYNTDHLLSPKPKTYEEVVNRLEPLKCKLFYNIISSPDCRYEKRFSEGRIKDHYKTMDAENRFKNIFTEKIIYANPKSFFVNKLNIAPKDCEDIKSVSFAFSDYNDLPKHFEARNSEFGICFFHDFLQNKGLRPVEYLNENDNERIKKLVFNSPHLIEVYSKSYDMRWEEEWRLNYDLNFTQDDIAFVIVPQERHEHFIEWFYENEDFQDIQILTSNTFKSYVDHLIYYPQQKDNNWNQVEIFRDENGSGFKISPEDFNTLSEEDKSAFLKSNYKELNCFAKNTILLSYEFGYTNRFIKFRDKITNVTNLGHLFQDYDNIKANIEEPIEAQRDLIFGLFGSLYQANPIY
jgi:hypothetical protein